MKFHKKDNLYYLMKAILSCFPNNFEENFLSVINQHLIAKEYSRQILNNEVVSKKPRYKTLCGALILQNTFLSQLPSSAFYEVVEVMPAINFCFRSKKWKTINKLSSEVIFRLFITLYFEFFLLPLNVKFGKMYINKFKKYIARGDIVSIVKSAPFFYRIIAERQGVDLGFREEMVKNLNRILTQFYQ